MAVDSAWGTVSGPSGVCNSGVVVKDLGEVWLLGSDQLLQFGDFAHLFERKHLATLVAIDGKTGGVVASVLESCEAWSQLLLAHTLRPTERSARRGEGGERDGRGKCAAHH